MAVAMSAISLALALEVELFLSARNFCSASWAGFCLVKRISSSLSSLKWLKFQSVEKHLRMQWRMHFLNYLNSYSSPEKLLTDSLEFIYFSILRYRSYWPTNNYSKRTTKYSSFVILTPLRSYSCFISIGSRGATPTKISARTLRAVVDTFTFSALARIKIESSCLN